MSDGVQGIHDGNRQVCRLPEPGEGDGMSLAGPQREVELKTSVAIAREPIFIEGAKLLKRCGSEFIDPKSHYCMDGASMRYPDPKWLENYKREQELAKLTKWRDELAYARAHPARDGISTGEVIVGGLALVAGLIFAPEITVPLLLAGTMVACAPDNTDVPDRTPDLPKVEPNDPIVGSPTKDEPPQKVAQIKANECMPADYEVEIVFDTQKAKQPKWVTTAEGEELTDGDPVDGCSRMVLTDRADSYNKESNKVTFTGIVGEWNSADPDYGKIKPGSEGYDPILQKTTTLRASGAVLSELHFPYEYQEIYDAFADEAGFRWLSQDATMTVGQDGNCHLDMSFDTKKVGSVNETLKKFVLAVYQGDVCQGKHTNHLKDDGKTLDYVTYYDNESVIALDSAKLSFDWKRDTKAGWDAIASFELCGPGSANGPCKGTDFSSAEVVTARLEIHPKKQ